MDRIIAVFSIIIPVSPSQYHHPSITIQVSPSEYHHQSITIPVLPSEYHHPSITIAGPLRSNIGVGEKYHQVNQQLSTFPFLSSKHISYMFLPCHSLIISNESFQIDWQPNSFHIFINFWENSFQAGVRLDF